MSPARSAARPFLPVGDQRGQTARVDHRARQDMRAHLGPLLQHDHRQIGVELLQPDRRGQPGRARRRRSPRHIPSIRARAPSGPSRGWRGLPVVCAMSVPFFLGGNRDGAPGVAAGASRRPAEFSLAISRTPGSLGRKCNTHGGPARDESAPEAVIERLRRSPGRPMEKIPMTRAGAAALNAELKNLKSVERPAVIARHRRGARTGRPVRERRIPFGPRKAELHRGPHQGDRGPAGPGRGDRPVDAVGPDQVRRHGQAGGRGYRRGKDLPDRRRTRGELERAC